MSGPITAAAQVMAWDAHGQARSWDTSWAPRPTTATEFWPFVGDSERRSWLAKAESVVIALADGGWLR